MASIARSRAAPPREPSGPHRRSRSGRRCSVCGPAAFRCRGPGCGSTSPSAVRSRRQPSPGPLRAARASPGPRVVLDIPVLSQVLGRALVQPPSSPVG
eukprot:15456696-Alexandrium_andersonii.AAC.1